MTNRGREIAKALIGKYGIRAVTVANYNVLWARQAGDLPKLEAWRSIAGATLEILRSEPDEAELAQGMPAGSD
jgi:hypothetical protein